MYAALLPISASLALSLSPGPTGYEIRREWIAPEARMALHFDFAGLRQTTFWKLLIEDEIQMELDELEEVRQEFGIDPLTDLLSVTVYSTNNELEEGVALITATSAIDSAIERLRMEQHLRTVVQDGLDIHILGEDQDDEDAYGYVHSLPTGERLIVLSDSMPSTMQAARIVRGEAPGHDEVASPALAINPGAASFLYVTAADLPGIDDIEPASRFFGLSKSIEIDVGESRGVMNLHVSVLTDSPEDALQASKMVDGFKALAYFAAQEFGEARSLLDAIKIDARGNEIFLNFEYDVRTLIDHIESLEDLGNF